MHNRGDRYACYSYSQCEAISPCTVRTPDILAQIRWRVPVLLTTVIKDLCYEVSPAWIPAFTPPGFGVIFELKVVRLTTLCTQLALETNFETQYNFVHNSYFAEFFQLWRAMGGLLITYVSKESANFVLIFRALQSFKKKHHPRDCNFEWLYVHVQRRFLADFFQIALDFHGGGDGVGHSPPARAQICVPLNGKFTTPQPSYFTTF